MTVRALVVDDSATMRAIVSRVLSADRDIEVVGTADGPAAARQMIKTLSPDVITLDVEMPGMNGLDFLEKIMTLRPMPVVMLSSLTSEGAETSLRALELGAVDCFAKPTQGFLAPANENEPTLPDVVKAAAASRVTARRRSTTTPMGAFEARPDALIAIGSSTGGVEALIEVLSGFPANCPPTMIVQHMPQGFTRTFAARLDRLIAPSVAEARSGEPLMPGKVYLAPGGEFHLELIGGSERRCRLIPDGLMSGHRPSVDRLFHSVAKVAGGSAVGAILTGMGRDGAAGLKAMRDAGSVTLGQDEATCVVYGMPQAAFALGAVQAQLPLGRVAGRLLRECQR